MHPPLRPAALTPAAATAVEDLPVPLEWPRVRRQWARPEKPRYTWLTLPSVVGLLVVAVLLVVVHPADRLAAVTAILNVAAAVALAYRFLTVNPTVGLIPTFFIMPMMVLTSISTLYFCVFSPDASVSPAGIRFRLLDNNARFQLATLTAIVSFSIPWLLFERRERPPITYAVVLEYSRRMAGPIMIFFVLFITMLLALRVANIGRDTPVGYVVYGFFRYAQGLPFVAGVAWKDLSRFRRWMIVLVLGANFVFNTFTNSRYYAFMPLVYFGFGLLFLSRINMRKKVRSLVVLVLLFGTALVVGNAGRRLGLGLWYGGTEDLLRRYEVLTQNTEALVSQNWADEVFIRLFFTGGHQITTLFPEVYAYKVADWTYYFSEVVSQAVLPRDIAKSMVPPVFEEKSSLLSIGHRLTESHGVERSFVGAAWEMGGVPSVIVVGLVAGCFMLLMAGVLRLVFGISPGMGVVVLAVLCDRTFTAINEGVPSLAHEMVYGTLIAVVLYLANAMIRSVVSPRAAVSRRPAL